VLEEKKKQINKKITFLLSLTFLFLFSGFVYGDEFQGGWCREGYKEPNSYIVSLQNREMLQHKKNLGLMY
jgi:hypothetical protein